MPSTHSSDFRGAIASQRLLIASYPDSQKVPDALLNIGSCQFELGDAAGARKTLRARRQASAVRGRRQGAAAALRALRRGTNPP